MSEYHIELTVEAKIDLAYYTIYERKIIVSEIRKQLAYEPHMETRNRKKLRETLSLHGNCVLENLGFSMKSSDQQ